MKFESVNIPAPIAATAYLIGRHHPKRGATGWARTLGTQGDDVPQPPNQPATHDETSSHGQKRSLFCLLAHQKERIELSLWSAFRNYFCLIVEAVTTCKMVGFVLGDGVWGCGGEEERQDWRDKGMP